MFSLMDVIPLIVVCLALWRFKFVKPLRTGINDDYLSLQSGKSLRGLLAISVVVHHLANRIPAEESGLVFGLFNNIGFLLVAVFFFLSGYGLQKQYIKNENYKNRFLLKRIPGILIPYIIMHLVYWLFELSCGNVYSIVDILKTLVNGSPFVAHSWYIICIIIFYVVFWMLMLVCRRRYRLVPVLGLVYYALWMVFCVKMHYGAWWYNTSSLLIVGMFWATYEERLNRIFKNMYWKCCLFVLFVFGTAFVLLSLLPTMDFPIKSIIISLMFTLLLIFALLKCRIGNPVLEFLGGISLELYLCHEVFLLMFKQLFVIKNNLLYSLVAIVCAVAFAYAFNRLNQAIMKWYKRAILK